MLTLARAGVAPYVAFNFASYELLKIWLVDHNSDHHEPGTFAKLMCGGVAGAVSQTVRECCACCLHSPLLTFCLNSSRTRQTCCDAGCRWSD